MAIMLWYRCMFLVVCASILLATGNNVVVFVRGDDSTTTLMTQCSVRPEDQSALDPALTEMSYDIGEGPESTLVYMEPPIASFYRGDPPASTKVTPKHNGLSGKFINMSNKRITLYWEDAKTNAKHPMRNQEPFSASGTATFPGHIFTFSPYNDPDQDLLRVVVKDYPANIYVYDPYTVEGDQDATERNLASNLTTAEERKKYDSWRTTLRFHEKYRNVTGRSYLANYLRPPPMHYMWRADYFGQEHWVTTRETHFVQMPPVEKLQSITERGKVRALQPDQPRLLQEYRVPDEKIMNLTLKTLSVAPRVFQIDNFLSAVEVEHILDLAQNNFSLSLSKTGEKTDPNEKRVQEESRRTRTSFNSWVPREKTPIIDAIYRRGANVLSMDEALLRYRGDGEWPGVSNEGSLAEQLQLVHYDVGQEYTAHHDFGFARIDDDKQGARFATLLLYLNEPDGGGETSFPRWVNAERFDQLKVPPVTGQAILFYSQLPDGNLDDFSQHAALPVTKGEKWLINLWVWSPEYK